MRIDDLLQKRHRPEKGMWVIIEDMDGTYTVQSARLGSRTFRDKADMEAFIAEYHRGTHPGWPPFLHVEMV